jgi:hypothetical protein
MSANHVRPLRVDDRSQRLDLGGKRGLRRRPIRIAHTKEVLDIPRLTMRSRITPGIMRCWSHGDKPCDGGPHDRLALSRGVGAASGPGVPS